MGMDKSCRAQIWGRRQEIISSLDGHTETLWSTPLGHGRGKQLLSDEGPDPITAKPSSWEPSCTMLQRECGSPLDHGRYKGGHVLETVPPSEYG